MTSAPGNRNLQPLWLGLGTLVLLLPFVGKAFHIDDPLFLWVARQIQAHPLDFYGFPVNWYGNWEPMAGVTKNPPLFAYYLALVTALFGWSEPAVHLASYLAPLGVVVGTYYLAEELGIEPVPAVLVTVTAPVFLVSATAVMCDVMMLAWWVWAMLFWLRGLRLERRTLLVAGALCVAAGFLTKYFAISLVPLLLVYTIRQRPQGWHWLAILLLPVLVVAGYQLLTARLYGVGHFSDAAGYASAFKSARGSNRLMELVSGTSYLGGGVVAGLFLSPLLWRRRVLAAALGVGALICAALAVLPWSAPLFLPNGAPNWLLMGHFILFFLTGGGLLVLTASDLCRSRDSQALLLFCWIAGTFVFATFLNWTVSARNILPLVPAAGLLVSRTIQQRRAAGSAIPRAGLALALVLSLGVALTVTSADYSWANTARLAAGEVGMNARIIPGAIYFQGHWGFQYYMEQAGAKPLDFSALELRKGDAVIIPEVNTNINPLADNGRFDIEKLRTIETRPFRWGATHDLTHGAGFYTNISGPVPYLLGENDPRNYQYHVYLCTRSTAAQAGSDSGRNVVQH
jgi:4-amino-4-deoxy-L-arabinose transferase-like glycosyltransferase